MAIAPVVTRGYGSFGGIALVPTRGYAPGSQALTAGHLSAVRHPASVDLSVAAASGGTPPYTYRFLRAVVVAGTPSGSVTIQQGPATTCTDADVAAGTTYRYTVVVIDSTPGTASSNSVDVTVAAPAGTPARIRFRAREPGRTFAAKGP